MSAKSKIKKRIIVVSIIILGVLSVAFIWALRYNESAGRISQAWDVEFLIADNIRIEDKLIDRGFSFHSNSNVLLPMYVKLRGNGSLNYATWKYKRDGIFDGKITISNDRQNTFNGVYDIEYLDNRKPELLKLSSERITFYLRGYTGFSTTNTTIKSRPYDNFPLEDSSRIEFLKSHDVEESNIE